MYKTKRNKAGKIYILHVSIYSYIYASFVFIYRYTDTIQNQN